MLGLKINIGQTYIKSSMILSVIIVLLVFLSLFISSFDAITQAGKSMLSLEWNPPKEKYGILSMLYGTFLVTLIALVISLPLGITTAIYTSEFINKKYRYFVKSFLELLAGIPSIIYGLIGIAFLAIWVQNIFDLQSGRSFFTAGILLAFMVLPVIISLVDDALQSIPKDYKEAASGLGLYKYEVIIKLLLPIAKPDIISAVLLGLGRAMGETMAVMLVIGSIDKIPNPFYNLLTPGQTVTSKLGREIAECAFGSLHFSVMIFMGLVLMVLVILCSLFAQRKSHINTRLYE